MLAQAFDMTQLTTLRFISHPFYNSNNSVDPKLIWIIFGRNTATGLDWIVQCFTSPPTQYRLYGSRFLQVKRPNQQYQSTEWRSKFYTLCSDKKHPLTFSSISPRVVCKFKRKLQWIYLRNGRFWPCRN